MTANSEMLTINLSTDDLAVIYKSVEKNLLASQLELAEMEKKITPLRIEVDRQIKMLSAMKERLYPSE